MLCQLLPSVSGAKQASLRLPVMSTLGCLVLTTNSLAHKSAQSPTMRRSGLGKLLPCKHQDNPAAVLHMVSFVSGAKTEPGVMLARHGPYHPAPCNIRLPLVGHLCSLSLQTPQSRRAAGGMGQRALAMGGLLPSPHPSGKGGIFLNGRAFWSWFLGIGARRPSPVIRDRHVPGFIFTFFGGSSYRASSCGGAHAPLHFYQFVCG